MTNVFGHFTRCFGSREQFLFGLELLAWRYFKRKLFDSFDSDIIRNYLMGQWLSVVAANLRNRTRTLQKVDGLGALKVQKTRFATDSCYFVSNYWWRSWWGRCIKIIPANDPKQCVGGQQQKILYVSLPIRGATTNHSKSVYKTYVCVFCTLRIWISSARVMSRIHVVASTKMDPLQDPHLRIHVSTSLCLRLLCKIHAAGSIAQQPYVSQDPLQDPRLRIHVSASLYLTDSLQDPRLRIHVSASIYISGSSARSMSPDPCVRFMS